MEGDAQGEGTGEEGPQTFCAFFTCAKSLPALCFVHQVKILQILFFFFFLMEASLCGHS